MRPRRASRRFTLRASPVVHDYFLKKSNSEKSAEPSGLVSGEASPARPVLGGCSVSIDDQMQQLRH